MIRECHVMPSSSLNIVDSVDRTRLPHNTGPMIGVYNQFHRCGVMQGGYSFLLSCDNS